MQQMNGAAACQRHQGFLHRLWPVLLARQWHLGEPWPAHEDQLLLPRLDNDAVNLDSSFVKPTPFLDDIISERETLLDNAACILTELVFAYALQSPPGGGGEGLSPSCPAPQQRSGVPSREGLWNTCSLPEGIAHAHAVHPVIAQHALHSRLDLYSFLFSVSASASASASLSSRFWHLPPGFCLSLQ